MAEPGNKPTVISLGPLDFKGCRSGAGVYPVLLNRLLAERGSSVHYFSGVPQGELGQGVVPHFLAPRNFKSSYRLYRALKKSINRLLDSTPVDLVHIHDPFTGFLALLNPRLRRLPMVCHYYRDKKAPPDDGGLPKTLLKMADFAERFCLKRARSIIFLSRFSRDEFLGSFSIRKPRLREIPFGADIETFYPLEAGSAFAELKEALGVPDEMVFLTLDHPGDRAGLENIILGFALATGRNQERVFHLLILGEKNPDQEVKVLVSRLGMKAKVHFLGPVPKESWLPYFQLPDAFLMPAPGSEVLEGDALNALAAGVPVFAPPDSGVAEVLRRTDESLLFWKDVPEAIANSLKYYFEHEEAVRALKPRCREEAVNLFSWNTVIDRIEEEYQVILKNDGS